MKRKWIEEGKLTSSAYWTVDNLPPITIVSFISFSSSSSTTCRAGGKWFIKWKTYLLCLTFSALQIVCLRRLTYWSKHAVAKAEIGSSTFFSSYILFFLPLIFIVEIERPYKVMYMFRVTCSAAEPLVLSLSGFFLPELRTFGQYTHALLLREFTQCNIPDAHTERFRSTRVCALSHRLRSLGNSGDGGVTTTGVPPITRRRFWHDTHQSHTANVRWCCTASSDGYCPPDGPLRPPYT